MKALLRRFGRQDAGATAIEYGLIAAFMGLGVIGGMTVFGDALQTQWDSLATTYLSASSR